MFTFSRSRRLVLAGAFGLALILAAGPLGAIAQTTHISTDPFTQATCNASNTTYHHTEVEPDTFSNGSTIVATFQVGRIFDGGSCAVGFATSSNNGSTWTSGLLPGITKHFGNGPNDRATDASVAYDAKHGVWLISTLTLLESGGVHGNSIVTSRSTDGGLKWSSPFTTALGTDLDKNWIVCDNTSTSRFYGQCYTQWDNHAAGNLLQMSTSTDGGQTWSAPATNGSGVIGGQPVVRPDGTVIVPIDNANETAIGAFNSTNGGASWSAITTIASISHHRVAGSLREGPLPSAEIDASGTVYVAWTDCRFRRSCRTNDIVISHSLNSTGTSWSAVSRVPIDATNSGIDHFIPGLAVNKSTLGSTAQLGITYYFYPSGSTQLSVGFVSSSNAGSAWTAPQTVASGMPSTWVASTSQGRMVGDYISTSYGSDNLAHGVFATASAPTSGSTCGAVLDNCAEPMDTFVSGLRASTVPTAADPVLFAGAGNSAQRADWSGGDNNTNSENNHHR
jgi:hypothetical protein